VRGQIRVFETVGILLIFFFLLALTASVYTKYSSWSQEQEEVRVAELKASQAAVTAFYLPELECSFIGVITPNCMDSLKVEALSSIMTEDLRDTVYFPVFGFSKVIVSEMWPEQKEPLTIYDNSLVVYDKIVLSRSPITLFDPVSNSYSFAMVEVSTYVA
jgi:hypothetical protein